MTDLDIVRELHGAADRAGLVCTKTGNFRAAMIDAAHLRAAADEIERLRAERDEARRMVCEEWAQQDGLPLDWQGRRGAEGMAEFVKWDCFKENTDD